MNNSPETSRPRYQKIRELGSNRHAGHITYLAMDNKTQQQVVIKQFLFASGSDWNSFKAYEREIQVLRLLNHPGIPRYLNSFESRSGFCMVQEYKDAQNLSVLRSFNPDEIKKITISILEILVYLQNQLPLVIHRDIKPENILLDNDLNVYLVDFGLARLGGGEATSSSVAAGTFGFMAPEQLYNRQLSEATDLYGLGATLACLVTGTKSTAIDTLIDEDGRIVFKHLVPNLSIQFINWLEKMVQPRLKQRFANAEVALETFKPIYVKNSHSGKLYSDAPEEANKFPQERRVDINEGEKIVSGINNKQEYDHSFDPLDKKTTTEQQIDNQKLDKFTTEFNGLFDAAILERAKKQLEQEKESIEEEFNLNVEEIEHKYRVKLNLTDGKKDDTPMDLLSKLGAAFFSVLMGASGVIFLGSWQWLGFGLIGFATLVLLGIIVVPTYSSKFVKEIEAEKAKRDEQQEKLKKLRLERVEHFKKIPLFSISDSFISGLSDVDRLFLLQALQEREDADKMNENLKNATKVALTVGGVALFVASKAFLGF